ncbi:MAG: glycosyl transferase [Lachnospiraceae bacterium]|nr:glycosyl transferase [Lachnospiraceae bacterium]
MKRKYFSIYDDIEFLKKKFEQRTGYKLNIDNPTTFNEKLQWLKIYNHNPEYTQMVDKYAVKEYLKEKIGEEYIIPTLGVYDNFDEINFSELPKQFVLKCTHDSGSVVIVDDAEKLDKKAVKERLNRALSINYFWAGREWPYKNVRPQIIAEKYLCDSSGTELKDYKFFCFNGSVKLIQVDFDRFVEHKRNVYNRQWEYIPLVIEFPTEPERIIRKPICFDEMIEIAEKLSIGIPHVRIDFYVIEDKPIVGEMTFYHGSGLEKIIPIEWDKILGDWIELPEKREYDNKT